MSGTYRWEVEVGFVGGSRTTTKIVEAPDRASAHRAAVDKCQAVNAVAREAWKLREVEP